VYCGYRISGPNKNLSLRDADTGSVRDAIKQAAEMGVLSISLSGGEPLLHPDVAVFLDTMRRNRVVSILHTNGLLLSKLGNQLLDAGLNFINLSLDSLDPLVFHEIRGVRLNQVLQGLYSALRLRDRYPYLIVNLTVVLTRRNICEITSLVNEVSKYNVGIQLTPYHHFETNTVDSLSPENNGVIEKVIGQIISMKQEGYPIQNSYPYLLHIPAFFRSQKDLPKHYSCTAADTGIFIDSKLDVRPCWDSFMPPMGNLRHHKLAEIWYSEVALHLRGRARRLECSRCWLLCTAELTIDQSQAVGVTEKYGERDV
jgi:MoaA/NifB/PqqE/SkfB family radical SAM enzyme